MSYTKLHVNKKKNQHNKENQLPTRWLTLSIPCYSLRTELFNSSCMKCMNSNIDPNLEIEFFEFTQHYIFFFPNTQPIAASLRTHMCNRFSIKKWQKSGVIFRFLLCIWCNHFHRKRIKSKNILHFFMMPW